MRTAPPVVLLAAFASALLATVVQAQSPEQRGRALVEALDQRAAGYGDFEATLTMRIREEDGERVRQMQVRGLEEADGDRTRIVLERPVDLAGTEFLSATGDDGSRSQWIYLRQARRVRRIAGSQASDAFLGSHFTYDDMTPPSVEGYTYRWIRDAELAGRPGALVERVDVEGKSPYPRQLLWIETERSLLYKVEFFDGEGRRRRELTFDDYAESDGFWRAGRMTMADLVEGGSTELEWSDIRIGVGLPPGDFDPSRLGR